MSAFQVRNFLRDQGGAISVIAALSLLMLLFIAAIVIDAGSLYFARRTLQSTNDAAALAAVQNPGNAASVAAAVFARNGYSNPDLTVTTGVYTADESLSAGDRFTSASSGVNAVRVRATVEQPAFFATVLGLNRLFPLATQAIAARVPTASFGAGTRLAELNGGLINSLLGALWGSSLSLSLIDYQSLVSTNVDALTFLDQLATDIDVTGSYDQLAGASVTTGQILTALIETTGTDGAASGDPTAALLALQSLQLQLGNGPSVQLSNLIDLSPLSGRTIGGISPGANPGLQLNLMGLLSANARSVATGRTTDIGTAITVPIVNSSVDTRISIGGGTAQVSDAQVGASVTPAQIRIALTAKLASINLGVATATVQLPVYMEVASGRATLTAMPCTVGGTLAEIAATSNTTHVTFGTVSDTALKDFSATVTPVAAPAVSLSLLGFPIQVQVSGEETVFGSGPAPLTFSQAEIDAGAVKRVPDGSATPFSALGGGMTFSASVGGNPGLLATLLNSQLSSLTAALNPVVANLLTQLDAPVNSLMTTLGLQLGVIDVRVFDASCRTPTLVG